MGLVEEISGHALEGNNPDIHSAAVTFLARRTMFDVPEKLKDITGNSLHEDHEITKVDRFIDPHFGRVYANGPDGNPHSTEIISLGLEYMAANPEKLAREDRELFMFLYTAVRNPGKVREKQEELLLNQAARRKNPSREGRAG